MGRELGRIRTRVREICRDGAELLEGGKRTMSPDRWQLVVMPNYQAYEATLIGQRQVDIARDELATMKREILVYAEQLYPTLTCPDCGAATMTIPCPRCLHRAPPVVALGDHNMQRARLLARFARDVQRPAHLEEARFA